MTDKIAADKIDPLILRQVQGPEVGQPGRQGSTAGSTSQAFADVLAREVAGQAVKFSAHAQARMRSRNIEMTERDLERLGDALDKAAAKGAKDSLVLLDGVAMVVSVPNRTVITAVDGESVKQNVFTNIDSAVIV